VKQENIVEKMLAILNRQPKKLVEIVKAERAAPGISVADVLDAFPGAKVIAKDKPPKGQVMTIDDDRLDQIAPRFQKWFVERGEWKVRIVGLQAGRRTGGKGKI
jgi:hypothetical protein